MAQNEGCHALPESGLQSDRAAVAPDGLDAAQNLAGFHRTIAAGPGIAARHDTVAHPVHHAVHHQSFTLTEYDNRIRIKLGGGAAPDRNLISGPQHGNHAGAGNSEMNPPGDTGYLCDKVAARRLEVCLVDHARR